MIKKKVPYVIVSRQAVHLHKSALRVQNQLGAHQNIFGVFVPQTPKLKQCLQKKIRGNLDLSCTTKRR